MAPHTAINPNGTANNLAVSKISINGITGFPWTCVRHAPSPPGGVTTARDSWVAIDGVRGRNLASAIPTVTADPGRGPACVSGGGARTFSGACRFWRMRRVATHRCKQIIRLCLRGSWASKCAYLSWGLLRWCLVIGKSTVFYVFLRVFLNLLFVWLLGEDF